MPVTRTYQFEDGTRKDITQSIKDPILKMIDGKPVKQIITGGIGTAFLGEDWNDQKKEKST
jgi:hypothetical protein